MASWPAGRTVTSGQIEELPDGYRVRRVAPDKSHPEGKLLLVHDRSPLRDMLRECQPEKAQRHQALQERHCHHLKVKRARLARDPSVPPEKRCV